MRFLWVAFILSILPRRLTIQRCNMGSGSGEAAPHTRSRNSLQMLKFLLTSVINFSADLQKSIIQVAMTNHRFWSRWVTTYFERTNIRIFLVSLMRWHETSQRLD